MGLDFIPLHIKMLQSELDLRKVRNHRYSLRAFAQFLGIGSSTLSRILMNTQEISISNSQIIIEKLNFSEDQSLLFIASIAEEKRTRASELINNFFENSHSVSSDWILSKSPEMIFVVNKYYQIIYVNDEGAKLYSSTPQELIGLTMRDVGAPEEVVQKLENDIDRTFEEKISLTTEDEFPLETRTLCMEKIIIPIFGKNNNVNAVACHIRDISERKKVESQLRFLVDIGGVLSSSYDYAQTLKVVVEMINSKLADGCFVHIMNDKHDVEVFKVSHKNSIKEEILRDLFTKYPYDENYPGFYHNVFKTGKMQFVPQVDDQILQKFCRNEEHLKSLVSLKANSYMCVPMQAMNKTIGTMTLLRSKGRAPFDLNDTVLVKELCLRSAWTIDCAMKLSR